MATKAEQPAAQPERYYEQYERYGFEKTLSNNRDIVTPNDERLIRDFVKQRIANKNIGIARQTKLGAVLVYWKRYINKQYCEINGDDLEDGMSNFRSALTKKGEPFKQNHQREMIVILKAFIKYLNSKNIINILEIQIKLIENPAIRTDTDRVETLFTEDEIRRMVAACPKNVSKAFIYTLYETGARPGEIARLKWRDIVPGENSIKITITDKKTKKERTAFVIDGKKYLELHASDTKITDIEPDNYVFKNSDGKSLDPHNAYNIIYYAMQKAGIKKHLKLKLFRKSRVSNMMKDGVNDGAIREQIWGNQGTTMFKVYAKYSSGDVEKAMLKKAGIEIKETTDNEQPKPKYHKCHVCGKFNDPDAKWCPQCGTPLIEEAIREYDSAIKEAEQLPEYKKLKDDYDNRLKALEEQIASMTNVNR